MCALLICLRYVSVPQHRYGVRPGVSAQSTSPDLAEVKRLREHVLTHRSNHQLVKNALTVRRLRPGPCLSWMPLAYLWGIQGKYGYYS
eukprot:COSAG05_NODE_561_length_8675_cov_3.694846_9_plen_88_part_00